MSVDAMRDQNSCAGYSTLAQPSIRVPLTGVDHQQIAARLRLFLPARASLRNDRRQWRCGWHSGISTSPRHQNNPRSTPITPVQSHAAALRYLRTDGAENYRSSRWQRRRTFRHRPVVTRSIRLCIHIEITKVMLPGRVAHNVTSRALGKGARHIAIGFVEPAGTFGHRQDDRLNCKKCKSPSLLTSITKVC